MHACILKQYTPYVTRGIVSHVLKLHLKSIVLSISLGKLSPTWRPWEWPTLARTCLVGSLNCCRAFQWMNAPQCIHSFSCWRPHWEFPGFEYHEQCCNQYSCAWLPVRVGRGRCWVAGLECLCILELFALAHLPFITTLSWHQWWLVVPLFHILANPWFFQMAAVPMIRNTIWSVWRPGHSRLWQWSQTGDLKSFPKTSL